MVCVDGAGVSLTGASISVDLGGRRIIKKKILED